MSRRLLILSSVLYVLIIAQLCGCATSAGVGKVASGLASVETDIRAARDSIDAALPAVSAGPAAHLADADRHLADGELQVSGSLRAEAAQSAELERITADDAKVRGTIGYRVEVFIIRAFWVIVIAGVVLWVASIVLFVFCGTAAGPVGIVARELHAILPLMAPANWIAALRAKPKTTPSVVTMDIRPATAAGTAG